MKKGSDPGDAEGKEKSRWGWRLKLGACEADSDVPFKVFFFMLFGGGGAFLPYVTLYFKQLGLSAGQAGVLTGLRHLSELLMAGWGWVADKYKKRRTILQLAIISYSASALIALVVQPQHQQCVAIGSKGNITQSTSLEFSQFGVTLGDYLYRAYPSRSGSNVTLTGESNSVKYQLKLNQEELNYMFAIILVLTVLGQIVGCVVFSMPETLLVAHLEDNVNKFGTIRLWGEISIAVTSFAVGAGINATETQVCGQTVKNYFIAFYCFAGFMTAALVASFWLKVKYNQPRLTSLRDLASHAANLETMSLLMATAFLGIFTGMNENFGLWFLDDLGGSSLLIGMAAGARYFISLVGYTTSPYLIGYFGEVRVLIATLLSYAFLFTGISTMKSPWAATVFYALEGCLHSLSWCSIVAYGGRVALQIGYLATIQGRNLNSRQNSQQN